ncbi:MAG: Zn-ribbon domain-containing OB-fold protein [Acidimicrobiales bacterium]
MGEVNLPERLRDVEQVRSVRTPAELRYRYTAGAATSRFLRGIEQKRLLGERAPGGKVYIPSRGSDPSLGVPTSEVVEVAHTGTLTSFCIVNVQFYGQAMEVPYTSGLILLDGADLPIMHLLQEVDVNDVRIGMRVEAVWVPDDELKATLESIRYFRPIDEPDVEVHQPGEHGWGDEPASRA